MLTSCLQTFLCKLIGLDAPSQIQMQQICMKKIIGFMTVKKIVFLFVCLCLKVYMLTIELLSTVSFSFFFCQVAYSQRHCDYDLSSLTQFSNKRRKKLISTRKRCELQRIKSRSFTSSILNAIVYFFLWFATICRFSPLLSHVLSIFLKL